MVIDSTTLRNELAALTHELGRLLPKPDGAHHDRHDGTINYRTGQCSDGGFDNELDQGPCRTVDQVTAHHGNSFSLCTRYGFRPAIEENLSGYGECR